MFLEIISKSNVQDIYYVSDNSTVIVTDFTKN
jgi:hypothetical protein